MLALALIAATMAPALTSSNANLGSPVVRVQRTSKLSASWTTLADATGATYYYNDQTGESQWEVPHYRAQALWHAVPTSGVYSEYAMRGGEERVLGRFDMIEQSPYVSRQQCLVRVAADGTATVLSTGKPPTLIRAHYDAPWFVLRKSRTVYDYVGNDDIWQQLLQGLDGAHVLSDGEQISLDIRDPESALFTIRCQDEATGLVGGYDAQYTDDGRWKWDGTEWIPAIGGGASEQIRLFEVEDELTC